jgi:transcriptional regulator with GAF, ATPase, and Fis domain
VSLEIIDSYQAFKDHAEQHFLEHKLRKNNWDLAKTAKLIGLPTVDVQMLIDKYKLKN